MRRRAFLQIVMPPHALAGARLSKCHNAASLEFIFENLEWISRLRNALESKHFNGQTRCGIFLFITCIIKHGTNPAHNCPGNKNVSHMKSTVLHKDGAQRTARFIEFGFENGSGSLTVWTRLQVLQVKLALPAIGLAGDRMDRRRHSDLLAGAE
jgi:hypothetical protein